ncbi:uncharacterized protein [Diadema setosum]|uniref:uncharacterized protein n=1 Tax=Diadema setosum TaxID=31175 RepID=UPI003B3A5E6F
MELHDEVIKDFAEIVKQFGGLVHFGFRGVQMTESSMEKMVTATRHIQTSKGIMFKYCKTQIDGDLDSFARGIHVKEREKNLRILIFHAKEDQAPIMQDDVKRDFYCTHFGL